MLLYCSRTLSPLVPQYLSSERKLLLKENLDTESNDTAQSTVSVVLGGFYVFLGFRIENNS